MGKLTDELSKRGLFDRTSSQDWKHTPLTISIIIGIIGAAVAVWHLSVYYRNDQLNEIRQQISVHSERIHAHPDLRDQVKLLEKKCDDNYDRIMDDIRQIKLSPARRRRLR